MGRKEKWIAKLQSGVVSQGYESTKDLAVKKQAAYFKSAAELEAKVKELSDGSPNILHFSYIAFAEEMWKKKTDAERWIIYNKWRARGLDAEVLQRIACVLFGLCFKSSWIWDDTSFWDTDRWW